MAKVLRDLSGLPVRVPKVCLTMIVKDEGHCIERCLSSVKPHIHAWCIVDTGSTDDTCTKILEAMKDIPGDLYRLPWKNFGKNRSEAAALGIIQGCDWLLTLDADEVFEGDLSDLEAHAECMGVDVLNFGEVGPRISLLNCRRPWIYPQAIHETPNCDEHLERRVIRSCGIRHVGDGSRHTEGWLDRDIESLRNEPMGPREHLHLALMLQHKGEHAEAIQHYIQSLGKHSDKPMVEFVLRRSLELAKAINAPESFTARLQSHLDELDDAKHLSILLSQLKVS